MLDTWLAIANVYQVQAQYDDALHTYENILTVINGAEVPEIEARVLTQIGNIYQNTAQYEEALLSYTAAVEIQQSLFDVSSDNRETIENIATVYSLMGCYDIALALADVTGDEEIITTVQEQVDALVENSDTETIPNDPDVCEPVEN